MQEGWGQPPTHIVQAIALERQAHAFSSSGQSNDGALRLGGKPACARRASLRTTNKTFQLPLRQHVHMGNGAQRLCLRVRQMVTARGA